MDTVISLPVESLHRENEIIPVPNEGIPLYDINRVERIKTREGVFSYRFTWKEKEYQMNTDEAGGTEFENQFPVFPYSMGKLLFNIRDTMKSIPFVATNIM